jgi:Domain of unknown function (DUF4760)
MKAAVALVLVSIMVLFLMPVRTQTVQESQQNKRVNITVTNQPTGTALAELFKQVDFNYTLDAGVSGVVTVALKDVPFDTALKAILNASDRQLTSSIEGGVYRIAPRTPILLKSLVEKPIELLTLLVLGISVVFVSKQIRETHDWNRRKATQEALNAIASGPMQEWRRHIFLKFNCDITTAEGDYNDFIKKLEAKQAAISRSELLSCDRLNIGISDPLIEDFKLNLLKIINLLEIICISIRHGIIDETITYDYLGKYVTSHYKFAKPLIEERRRLLKFYRGAMSLEKYAKSWEKQLQKDQEKMEELKKQREDQDIEMSMVEALPHLIKTSQKRWWN